MAKRKPIKEEGAFLRVSIVGLVEIFAEWDRRYRENPSAFMTEVDHLLRETPMSYGELCAFYFQKLAADIILRDVR